MSIRVGVALYLVKGSIYYNTPSYFHWVLVASAAESWASQPVRTLELKRPFNYAGYAHSFDSYDISRSTMIQSNFPAYDSGWRFPGNYGPQGWTCATWILQILWHLLGEGTWVSNRQFEQTYTRILNLGGELLEATNNAGYQGAVRVITNNPPELFEEGIMYEGQLEALMRTFLLSALVSTPLRPSGNQVQQVAFHRGGQEVEFSVTSETGPSKSIRLSETIKSKDPVALRWWTIDRTINNSPRLVEGKMSLSNKNFSKEDGRKNRTESGVGQPVGPELEAVPVQESPAGWD
ncbi:hypothetical protein EV368DRAFT_63523 [Lentinula lateritia]|uniref:Uncharacterized protein n=1 Tax=Lentinula aff. lateritia TaxID=2804960 RepID=A0ACC1U0W0_9AGAR|nr:hypothetical protein F5876DRAFT_65509 [Lentinula aff. lateritia]KAJ3854138.1 hypothetical protein EV368DRAFT_63523 [Lentinula lateritia]